MVATQVLGTCAEMCVSSSLTLGTMSKRYSESFDQDLNNGLVKSGQRNARSWGWKRRTQLFPVVLDVFKGDAPQVFKK